MPLNLSSLINGAGSYAAGAVPAYQAQQAQQARAALLNKLAMAAQAQQAGQQPGFSPYPSANAGTTLPNGAPVGGPPPMPGSAPNPMAGGAPPLPNLPGAISTPPVTPYGGPQMQPASDPFSYGNLVQAGFGKGNGGTADVAALDAQEQSMAPERFLSRTALQQQGQTARTEAQIGSRENIASMVEQGRNSRFYVTEARQAQHMSNVALQAANASVTQQLVSEQNLGKAADPVKIEQLSARAAALNDALYQRSQVAGFKGVAIPPPSAGGGAYKSLEDLQSAYASGKITAEEAQKLAVKNGWAQ